MRDAYILGQVRSPVSRLAAARTAFQLASASARIWSADLSLAPASSAFKSRTRPTTMGRNDSTALMMRMASGVSDTAPPIEGSRWRVQAAHQVERRFEI